MPKGAMPQSLGGILTYGPGCYNMALIVDLEDAQAEAFANTLTMALMPAKWCVTEDQRLQVGQFITEVE